MTDSAKSSFTHLLKNTREIALKHLAATIDHSVLYSGTIPKGENVEGKRFIQEIFVGLNTEDRCTLKQIEKDLRGQYPAPEDEVDHLTKLLGVWLTWYFAGVPAVQLWQEVLGRLRRDVALPTFAFKMKAYGDVYRIERRRYDERAKLFSTERDAEAAKAEEDLESLEGIVTVVDHSTITHPNEESLLLDPRISLCDADYNVSANDKPEQKAQALEQVLQLIERTPDRELFCIRALTELLARIYCSVQIFRYIKARLPLKLFLLPCEAEVLETARKFSATRLDPAGMKQLAYTFPDKSNSVKGIPVCVIGTHTGVVREEGQWLGSPAGRKFDTRRFTTLANDVRRLEKKDDKQQFFPSVLTP